jgi:phosphatidylglycerophosphatase A
LTNLSLKTSTEMQMTEKTDPAPLAAQTSSAVTPSSASAAKLQKKPRFALFIATAAGLGYLPKAPGTWGSLAGLLLAIFPLFLYFGPDTPGSARSDFGDFLFSVPAWYSSHFGWEYVFLLVLISAVGVWAATRAAEFWQEKDPGRVVIDEVSGQYLTLLLGCGVPLWWKVSYLPYAPIAPGYIIMSSLLNWKYLLLGFILFRLFDIWKPFPARQAESLPGGWGIMTDDWVAGIYAALGLWLARAAGL